MHAASAGGRLLNLTLCTFLGAWVSEVDHEGKRAFVGERLDHLFQIADVMFSALKSEPWAIERMGLFHRSARFIGVVSFASRK